MFDIAIAVAKGRFWYHANMCSLVNAANQLGFIKDDDADHMNAKHIYKSLSAIARLENMGFDVKKYLDKWWKV